MFSSTRFTPFTSCPLWSLCPFLSNLFSHKTFSRRTWIITVSSGWKVLVLPVLLPFELIRNYKMLRITVQLQLQQFGFPLKTRVANYLHTRLDIYQPTWNPRVMPNRVPTVRSTKGRHSCVRTLVSSAGVSWRRLIGYPSYVRNCACTLPSPSPFHCVMAKIVPAVQLAAHAKSSTL